MTKPNEKYPLNDKFPVTKFSDMEGFYFPNTVDYYQPAFDPGNNSEAPSGLLSVYDPNNPDRQFVDTIEQELIEITSPPSLWYPIDKRKTILDTTTGETELRFFDSPVLVHCNYEDVDIESSLTTFGIESIVELSAHFNYSWLIQNFINLPSEGDLIQLHDGRFLEIVRAWRGEQTLFRYQHYHITLKSIPIEGYVVTVNGKEIELSTSPDFWPNHAAQAVKDFHPRKNDEVK
jgi:hypothetical protein